jgi:hypothetical protein
MKFEVCNLKLKVKWAALVVVLALGSGLTCGGAQGGNSKPATAPAKTVVTNAAPAKSLFIQPTGPAEGKDPFYPHSVYPYLHGDKPVEPTPIKPTTQVADVDVKLNGISGTRDHPLAIINGHTFEAGEEWEVNVANGNKAHVRCLEIKPEGVLIFVNGVRRELRLRGGL